MILLIFLPALLLVIVCIYIGVSSSNDVGERARKAAATKKALSAELGTEEVYVHPYSQSCIAIAWEIRKIVVRAPFSEPRTYDFGKLAASEIKVNSQTITTYESKTKTDRASQAVGAAIGGLAFGPAGAVVGALSGSKTSSGTSESFDEETFISLLIRFRDRSNPMADILFADLMDAQKYHAHLMNIMDEQ